MSTLKAIAERFVGTLRLSRKGEPTATRLTSANRLYLPDRLDGLIQELAELPDPDTVLEKLGRSRADLRAMEGDDEISQCIETRRDALIATPWHLEPGDGEITDWVWRQLERNIEPLLSTAWSAVPYGYSIARAVYEEPEPGSPSGAYIGGLAGVEQLEFELFSVWSDNQWYRRLTVDSTPELLAAWETEYLYFPTVRRGSKRNPYGEALLSRSYWPWFFRHNGWRFWMQALERFGTPLLLGRTHGDTGEMARALAQAVQDAVIAVGINDDVQAISSANIGDAFDKAEIRMVQRIQKLFLGQTLTSGVDGGGSYAAAKVHNSVREDKRNADIRLVVPTVQRVINALTALRFGPEAEAPVFVMEDNTGLQKDRAERDGILVNAGALELTEDYFLRVYDFEKGDFKIPEGGASVPMSRAHGGHGLLLSAQPQRFTQDQESVEELIGAALAEAQSPIPAKALRSAILAAESPEDLYERLARLYTSEDAAAFQELMGRALFAADVLGYETAQNRVGV